MSVFSYSLVDAAGVPGSIALYIDHATSLTAADLAVQAIAIGTMIDNITAAEITEVNINLKVVPDAGWKAAPIADVDMEQSLLLGFQITTTPYSQEVLVPALRDTLIVDGRPVLTAAGAIDVLRDAIVSGTGLTGVTIESQFLMALTDLLAASVTFRSHKKKRKAVSRVVNPA